MTSNNQTGLPHGLGLSRHKAKPSGRARLQHKEPDGNGTYRAERQWLLRDLNPANTFPARQVILPARRQDRAGRNWLFWATFGS
jgi:hypothetical protein